MAWFFFLNEIQVKLWDNIIGIKYCVMELCGINLEGVSMSEMTFSFTIQGDSEGYVTLECPFCRSEFKIKAGEFQNDDKPVIDLFCPYCGLTSGKNNFYTRETLEKAQALATNYAIELINKTFGKMARNINGKNKGVIKMDFRPLKLVNVKELKDRDTTEEIFTCSCCENNVKVLYCSGVSKVYCPYCGVDL